MTASPSRHWTFLSNHAHVLVCLAIDPDARLRDVALSVGITERAVQKIVSDLEEAGVIIRERSGRRNSYRLDLDVPLAARAGIAQDRRHAAVAGARPCRAQARPFRVAALRVCASPCGGTSRHWPAT